MYFTSGSDRAFEQLMQTRPGADHFDNGEAGAPEDCGTCRFYRPHWKYQFCVYEECPYQPGKLTALDGAVKFQVKGVDDEMAVFRVEKNRGYTVMSNHHLRNKDLSLKAKGLLSQMLSLPEDWDFTLKGLSCSMELTPTLILNLVLLIVPPVVLVLVFRQWLAQHIRWTVALTALCDVLLFWDELFYYESFGLFAVLILVQLAATGAAAFHIYNKQRKD